MICKKCGNQLNDNALFCPKCGQKADNQVSNTTNINPVNNISGEGTHKKKHTLRTVLLSVTATIIVLFGGLFWIGSQAPSSVETGSSSASVSSEQNEVESNVPSQDMETGNVSSPEAVKELLGYIDQAKELTIKALSDEEAIEEVGYEKFRQSADIQEKLLSDISGLRQQADSVKDINGNLADARDEFFNMLYDSQKAWFEIMTFYSDYFKFSVENLAYRPEDVFGSEEHCNNLYAWYQEAKEAYLAIDSCPPCLESEWKQYGDTLALNESIARKEYQAISYNDYLRLYSAIYMSNRYNMINELQTDAFRYRLLDDESGHLMWQVELADNLINEIQAYAELEEKERSGYEFEYVRTNEIRLDYEAVDTIYPSLYNTYNAFLIVQTGCASGTRTILVEAEIPGFTQMYKESFTLDSSYRAIYIKPPALTGDLDLSSAKDAQINVTISEQDGTLIDAKTFPITIKSKYDKILYTDEYGVATKDNALCWLTPESSAISELKRVAIEEMSNMFGESNESFIGYQGESIDVYMQVAGIMRAMYEMGVRYNMDPFSFDEVSQHVLFPEDVLNQRSGLCIETALTVASALQSAGMHAFLVCPPGHAQVALETGDGTGQYFLIETTCLSADSNNRDLFILDLNQCIDRKTWEAIDPQKNNNRYTNAIRYFTPEEWNAYLSVEGTYLIDCNDSVVLGLTPFAN